MRKHDVTGIHEVLVIVLLGFGLERAAAVTHAPRPPLAQGSHNWRTR